MNDQADAPVLVRSTADQVATLTLNRPRQYNALSAALLAALNGLREEERLVIACRYFLDLSEAETAATLGIRRGTVKSRLSRALERLRASMGVSADG